MIYLAQDTVTLHIKIGFTDQDDATERVRQLQTGNPFPIVLLCTLDGDRERERQLHQDYASAHIAGEWFRPVPGILHLLVVAGYFAHRQEIKRKFLALLEDFS